MSSLRAWFRGSSSAAAAPTKSTTLSVPDKGSGGGGGGELSPADRELADLEDAVTAAGLIMNDDIDGAEARLRLRKDASSFHMLGLGVAVFMRSVLGFEKEVMNEASQRLIDCENRAWADMKKAQKDAAGAAGGGWFSGGRPALSAAEVSAAAPGNISQIYPPGSEFALVYAEAQLMSAVVAVIHESLTEGIKGFYKMRKAYIALDGLMATEAKILERLNGKAPGSANGSAKRPSLAEEHMPGSFDETEFEEYGFSDKPQGAEDKEKEDRDLDFVDAQEEQSGRQTPATYEGHLGKAGSTDPSRTGTPTLEKQITDLKISQKASEADSVPSRTVTPKPLTRTRSGPDSAFFSNPVDAFVHSGANMCFGTMLLIISMVPPAFSRLLSIIGFRGDRQRGVRMLWQSTKFANINGAVAGLMLLGYYNGLLAFADILPAAADIAELAADDDEVVGYPQERCTALLASMRRRYPDARLWRLEEARVLANAKRLDEAVAVLRANADSKMKQVTALNSFELSLNSMFRMDYPLMRDAFLRCVELNDWSHTLYYFLAGCAELEMYRDAFHRAAALAADGDDDGDEAKAKEKGEAEAEARMHKKAAEGYIRKAPEVAGRKKFMARQMPFEVWVNRKVNKWAERAASLGVDLADAVGASPVQEMIYLWNGAKRMDGPLLERALACLDWGRCTAPPEAVDKMRAVADESAIRGLAVSALTRSMGKTEEAREVLKAEVLCHDRQAFKGPTKDDYVLPAGNYELGALAWQEACEPPAELLLGGPQAVDEYRQRKTAECLEALDRVARWEGFVLDARIGMRVQTGIDSVQWLVKKKGWVFLAPPLTPPRALAPVLQPLDPLLHDRQAVVDRLLAPLLDVVLLGLVPDVLHDVLAEARAVRPVEEAPRAEVAAPAAAVVQRGPARDAAHDDAGHDAVPARGQRLLDGDEPDEEQVGQQVRAQGEGRQVLRQEAVEQARRRVVGEDEQREGRVAARVGVAAAVPAAEAAGEAGGPGAGLLRRRQGEAVDVVGQTLAQGHEQDDVLDHLPGQGQGRGGAEDGPAAEGGVAQRDGGLDEGAEEEVEQGETQKAGEAGRVAGRQAAGAAVLDRLGEGGEEGVEGEEEQRGQEPEQHAQEEHADELDAQGRVGQDQRGPGHVEEEEVEGGGPRGHGGREEVGDDGEREQDVHVD